MFFFPPPLCPVRKYGMLGKTTDKGALDMRLISWNVNGLRSCLGKGFLGISAPSRTRTSSACRRRKCARSRRSLICRATACSGTARTRPATPAPPCSPVGSRCPSPTISALFSPASHLPMTTARLKQVSPVPAAFYAAPPVSAPPTPAPA